MILTVDSTQARATNRRPAKEGFNTVFMGANKYSIGADDPLPDPKALYPVAFLVEKEPGAVVAPHFHEARQFQVVVGGGGRFGTHDVRGVTVHYTDPYTAYGPIVASEEGISWFTLRPTWDPGAKWMPENRAELRGSRPRHQHHEASVGPAPALTGEELAALSGTQTASILQDDTLEGVGAWRHRMAAGTALRGEDPARGGGQYWLVVAGTARANGSAPLPVNSCVFVAPDEAPLSVMAGEGGAELLCMQFPTNRQPDASSGAAS